MKLNALSDPLQIFLLRGIHPLANNTGILLHANVCGFVQRIIF